MGNQVVGRAKISLGELGEIATEKGATMDFGGTKRTPKPADNRRVYFSEETGVPKLSCKVMARQDMSPDKLDISNATVLFEADTGMKAMMVNAFTLDPAPLNTSDGTYDLELSAEVVEVV